MNYKKGYWGIEEISDEKLNFYHALLSKHSVKVLAQNISSFREINCEGDKEFSLIFDPSQKNKINEELITFLTQLDSKFINTPKYSYDLSSTFKSFLNEYLVSFEASLALILMFKILNKEFLTGEWHLLDSTIGGLYIKPYTIIFEQTFAKVIHPMNFKNYFERSEIERVIAVSIRGISERVEEAERDFMGQAMLSYVEEKTGLNGETISDLVQTKTRDIRFHKNSSLLL